MEPEESLVLAKSIASTSASDASRGPSRNPLGRNQYDEALKASDERLKRVLESYHREKLSNNKKISQRLLAEHGIKMSQSTVKRRRRELGLLGSGVSTKVLPYAHAEQFVLAHVDKDLSRREGKRTIQQKIAFYDGVHLTREFVSEVIQKYDNHRFGPRAPGTKKGRLPKQPLGIHETWSLEGHSKLSGIGFPVWAIVDDASGKCLGAWVVPRTQISGSIPYLLLSIVEKLGGMPLHFISGSESESESAKLQGLVKGLRTAFHPQQDGNEAPARVYLRSYENLTFDHPWLRLKIDFADNAIAVFNKGIRDGTYNPESPGESELCQWLWSKLLQTSLQTSMDFRNGSRIRKDPNRPTGPFGISHNEAFSLPENWGGKNLLIPVDMQRVQEIKEAIGGDTLLQFVSSHFAESAAMVYESLGPGSIKLTFENVWEIFNAMRVQLLLGH